MPTATPSAPLAVYVAGSSVVHAGRVVGNYPSGATRYAKLCAGNGAANHEPGKLEDGTPVTCKRCLVKLAARAA